MPHSILVFCAHSDDQVLGAGGTLAKYAQEGARITVVVFSFGELSHPWFQRHVTTQMRVEESKKAGSLIGSKDLLFLGLQEGKFHEQFKEKRLHDKIVQVIHTRKPDRIFIHSPDDIHPDHRDVYTLITSILREKRLDIDTYAFEVWNPVNVLKGDWPQLYVDVSDTFKDKLAALGAFKSQKVALTVLMGGVLMTALLSGIHHGCRFAERFYKVPL